MESPRYTAVIPMARFRADEPALVALRSQPPPRGGLQIIVAEGAHPARQRNRAVARARSEIVVFLDNDCTPGDDFWAELDRAFAQPEVEIVGGPALLRSGASAWEEIFQALLTHPLIVGSVAARYSPRGEFRPATQSDLILCNLAVRRILFARIGPLSSELYPNEENEWLDRAHAAGAGAYYDPQLQVFRPQRNGPGAMFNTLLRYGIGRTRQFHVSGWRMTFHQLLPLLLLAAIAAVVVARLEVEFVVLWLTASAIIAVTCPRGLRGGRRWVAGLIAPAIPATYALGQLAGWIALFFPAPHARDPITLRDEHGRLLDGEDDG